MALKKVRICINCKKLPPNIRKTGLGYMLKCVCSECGKDVGFKFVEVKSK